MDECELVKEMEKKGWGRDGEKMIMFEMGCVPPLLATAPFKTVGYNTRYSLKFPLIKSHNSKITNRKLF